LIEYTGRRPIQFFGFLFEALFLGILAGDYSHLKTKHASFIAVFALLQLSFNFGANATTFILPAEVYPTRVRGTAHGLSAACGKCGAVSICSLSAHRICLTAIGRSFLPLSSPLLQPTLARTMSFGSSLPFQSWERA